MAEQTHPTPSSPTERQASPHQPTTLPAGDAGKVRGAADFNHAAAIADDANALALRLLCHREDICPAARRIMDNAAALRADNDRLREAHEPNATPAGPDFLDWLADRLVHVYGENPGHDFVLAVRRKAAKARAALEPKP